jgi:hypothetical protein
VQRKSLKANYVNLHGKTRSVCTQNTDLKSYSVGKNTIPRRFQPNCLVSSMESHNAHNCALPWLEGRMHRVGRNSEKLQVMGPTDNMGQTMSFTNLEFLLPRTRHALLNKKSNPSIMRWGRICKCVPDIENYVSQRYLILDILIRYQIGLNFLD